MFTRLQLLTITLIIAAVLSACAGTAPADSDDPGSAPASEIAATSPAAVVTPPEAPTQTELVSTPMPKVGAIETAALMLKFNDSGGKFTLRLVDTTNGAGVPGHEPISFTSVGVYTYLPDQQTLAMMVYDSQHSPLRPQLVLLDIPAWKTSVVPLTLDGWSTAIAVSKDGARIAVAGYGKGKNLALVDALKGAAIAEASVPNLVRALSFTQDGSGLMVYASNEDIQNGLSLGAPQALLLGGEDLSPIWQTDLAAVRDAFVPGPDYEGETHSPGAGTRYLPGVAFSPVSDTLYVVHADEDRLSSVDFSSRRVAARDIRPPLSFIQRFLSLGAGVAHAKVQSGTEKHVAVALDGEQLYITGIDNQFTKKDNGEWDLHQQALGLKVVDAATGSEMLSLETQADQVAVMPDGLVLLRTWNGNLPSTEIYDPAAREIVRRYAGMYQNCVPLTKGGYVLAPSILFNDYKTPEMQVYDPGSEKAIASWEIDNANTQWLAYNP